MRKEKLFISLSSVDVRDQWSSCIKINEHYFGHAFNVAHKIHEMPMRHRKMQFNYQFNQFKELHLYVISCLPKSPRSRLSPALSSILIYMH